MPSKVSVLVYGDAHETGLELLSRRDVDLRWALTLEEALAVSRASELDLVLTSDKFGLEYLRSVGGAGGQPMRRPTVVVVNDATAWDARDEFQRLGALALVAANDRGAAIAAISEITGLAFRQHARIPFDGIADVTVGGRTLYLHAIDLSASGISLRGFPAVGQRELADLVFEVGDHSVVASAMVVRTFSTDEDRCAGLSFVSISPDDRRRIVATVEAEHKAARDVWPGMPVSDASELGEQTQDLMQRVGHDAAATDAYLEMLRRAVRAGSADGLPRWLDEIQKSLVPEERRNLCGDESAADWTNATIHARVDLGRQTLTAETDPSYRPALDLCMWLIDESTGAEDALLVQVARVRADLLRAVNALVLAGRGRSGHHGAASPALRRATAGRPPPAPM